MLVITVDMTEYSQEEREAFASDVRAIINDERRNAEDAQKVLMARIGGRKNLRAYVDCLMAGMRKAGAQ